MSTPFWLPDNRNHAIRYIDSSGVISTPALTSSDPVWIENAGLTGPWGIAITRDGKTVFLVDQAAEVIWAIDTTTFVVNRTAGFGVGTGAKGWLFGDIYNLTVDSVGNVYVGDVVQQGIVAINNQSTTQTLLGVSIPAAGAAYVAGHNGMGFTGDGGLATAAKINAPYGMACDSSGNLLFCDQINNRIRRIDAVTGIITTVVGSGPVGNGTGTYTGDGGVPTSATLNAPLGFTIDQAGNYYITDFLNNVIRAINNQATSQTICGTVVAPGTINTIRAAVVDQTFNMWFCAFDEGASGLGFSDLEALNGRQLFLNSSGAIVSIAGTGTFGTITGNGGPATSARIGEAYGLAFVNTAPTPPVPTGAGALFKLSETQLSDQQLSGTTLTASAINSTYTTYGFVNAAKSTQNPLLGFHRKRFSETQMYIKGSGQATMKAFPNYILKQDGLTFNPYVYTAPPIVLQTDPIDDIVRPLNISGNRVFVMYSTNAVGATFSLSKTILCGNIDSFSTVNPNA